MRFQCPGLNHLQQFLVVFLESLLHKTGGLRVQSELVVFGDALACRDASVVQLSTVNPALSRSLSASCPQAAITSRPREYRTNAGTPQSTRILRNSSI